MDATHRPVDHAPPRVAVAEPAPPAPSIVPTSDADNPVSSVATIPEPAPDWLIDVSDDATVITSNVRPPTVPIVETVPPEAPWCTHANAKVAGRRHRPLRDIKFPFLF